MNEALCKAAVEQEAMRSGETPSLDIGNVKFVSTDEARMVRCSVGPVRAEIAANRLADLGLVALVRAPRALPSQNMLIQRR